MFIDRSVTPHVVYAPFPYYEKNASRCELIWQLPTLPQDGTDATAMPTEEYTNRETAVPPC